MGAGSSERRSSRKKSMTVTGPLTGPVRKQSEFPTQDLCHHTITKTHEKVEVVVMIF